MPKDAKPLVDLDPFLLRQNPDVSTTEAVELKGSFYAKGT